MKPWVKKAFQTGLLSPISLERGEFSLKGTEFIVVVRRDANVWKKKHLRVRIKNTRQAGATGVAAWDPSPLYPTYISCSFEEVFNNCPNNIKEQMIYHLDTLNKGTMSYSDSTSIRGINTDHLGIDEI